MSPLPVRLNASFPQLYTGLAAAHCHSHPASPSQRGSSHALMRHCGECWPDGRTRDKRVEPRNHSEDPSRRWPTILSCQMRTHTICTRTASDSPFHPNILPLVHLHLPSVVVCLVGTSRTLSPASRGCLLLSRRLHAAAYPTSFGKRYSTDRRFIERSITPSCSGHGPFNSK